MVRMVLTATVLIAANTEILHQFGVQNAGRLARRLIETRRPNMLSPNDIEPYVPW